jgi:hypothetical protein
MKNLKIIVTILLLSISIQGFAQAWTGTWTSTYGELRLIEQGNKVYGDYANKGMIEGTITNNTLNGTFKNGTNIGNFTFTLNKEAFSGNWNWPNATKKENWTGTRVNTAKPTLISEAKNFITINKYTVSTNKPIVAEYPKKFVFVDVLKSAIVNNNPKVTLEASNNSNNSIKETVKEGAKETTSGGKRCTTSRKDYDVDTADFGYFVSTGIPEYIKPGVLMLYQDVLSGSNKVNIIERNPLTIYLESTSAGYNNSTLSEEVNNPQSISNINNAVSKLRDKINSNSIPANMSIEVSEIYSEEQLQYGISGSYNNNAIGIGAKFNIKNEDFSSSYIYMIKFTQNMATMRVDNSTFSFKNNNVPNSDKLAYISEVTYGRKGFLLIKTKKSKSQLEASLNVKINTGIQSGNVNAFINKVKEDKTSEVNMFFYGGNASTAAKSLQDVDFTTGFNNWVADNAGNGLLALPISYKLKNINGDQLLLSSVFSINQQTCVPIKEYKLQIELEQIKNNESNDSDKIDDYVLEFEPILKIDGKTYRMTNKKMNTTQSYVPQDDNKLFYWDRNEPKNQLHVKQSDTRSIKNSGVFIIPEDANLANAELSIRFKIHESTGTSLDRIVGVSKMGDYNIHEHNLLELIQVLEGTKKLEIYPVYNKEKKGTPYGNYGGTTKRYLSSGTVPVEYDVSDNKVLRAGEYMKNETKTRALGINYTFKLVN